MSEYRDAELDPPLWAALSDDSDSGGSTLSSTGSLGCCDSSSVGFTSSLASYSVDASHEADEPIVYMPRSYLGLEPEESSWKKASAPLEKVIDAFVQRNANNAIIKPASDSSNRYRSSTAPVGAGRRVDKAPDKQRSKSLGNGNKTQKSAIKTKGFDALTQNFVKFLSKGKPASPTSRRRSTKRRNTESSIWYELDLLARDPSALRHSETMKVGKPSRYLSDPADLNHFINIMRTRKQNFSKAQDRLSVHSSPPCSDDSFSTDDGLFSSPNLSGASCMSLDQMYASLHNEHESSMMTYLMQRFSLSYEEHHRVKEESFEESQSEETCSVESPGLSQGRNDERCVDGLCGSNTSKHHGVDGESCRSSPVGEPFASLRRRRYMNPVRFRRANKCAPKPFLTRKRSNTAPPYLQADTLNNVCTDASTETYSLEQSDSCSSLPGKDYGDMSSKSETTLLKYEDLEGTESSLEYARDFSSVPCFTETLNQMPTEMSACRAMRKEVACVAVGPLSTVGHSDRYEDVRTAWIKRDRNRADSGLGLESTIEDDDPDMSSVKLPSRSDPSRRCVVNYTNRCIRVETCV